MKISTKGKYGLRIMLDIAKNGGTQPVRIADIAARQEMSAKYAEQIACTLAKEGLLRSVRGAQGGYGLIKPAAQYTAGEIVRALEGELAPAGCNGEIPCARKADCATRDVWVGLQRVINEYLDGITLADLLGSGADYYVI